MAFSKKNHSTHSTPLNYSKYFSLLTLSTAFLQKACGPGKNETISYNDISSQYPYELSRKLPISDYKFVENFDEMKYGQDKNHGCFLLCDVKINDKIRNDPLYSQCPLLISRFKITHKNLSKYQLNQIKKKTK